MHNTHSKIRERSIMVWDFIPCWKVQTNTCKVYKIFLVNICEVKLMEKKSCLDIHANMHTYMQSCLFVRFILFIIKSLIHYYIIYCFYTVCYTGLLFKKMFWCVQMMICEITEIH